ncbi:extensin family protein [Rhizobium sp. CSW-27]|uniref:extensin-like domain-containing protein n=1 Tax=Rhizobium sp. CSW-27 TaxID=2839985 RepID=UPI001C030B2C|nr:extensin family protein [Rhizobium sp. CSW-27]MBT9369586.1 extensin family protein [Rhizobium sp. CSW-27]
MFARLVAAATAMLMLTGMDLPEKGPRPAEKPVAAVPAAPPVKPTPATAPVPQERPEPAQDAGAPAATAKPAVDSAPDAAPQNDVEMEEEPSAPQAQTPLPAIAREDPAALKACLADLQRLGTRYETRASIVGDEPGCGIESPIVVRNILPDIALSEPTPMRCETALSLARWMAQTVVPALHIAFPERRITGLRNAAAYSCRKRNGAEDGKISEHARGNAIDITGFELDDRETIAMSPRQEDSSMTGAFQRTVTAGACLHFSTVLSPGSDATHQDHLHLDVLERKGGYRYCR